MVAHISGLPGNHFIAAWQCKWCEYRSFYKALETTNKMLRQLFQMHWTLAIKTVCTHTGNHFIKTDDLKSIKQLWYLLMINFTTKQTIKEDVYADYDYVLRSSTALLAIMHY